MQSKSAIFAQWKSYCGQVDTGSAGVFNPQAVAIFIFNIEFILEAAEEAPFRVLQIGLTELCLYKDFVRRKASKRVAALWISTREAVPICNNV